MVSMARILAHRRGFKLLINIPLALAKNTAFHDVSMLMLSCRGFIFRSKEHASWSRSIEVFLIKPPKPSIQRIPGDSESEICNESSRQRGSKHRGEELKDTSLA
jgi:hypothetical protein